MKLFEIVNKNIKHMRMLNSMSIKELAYRVGLEENYINSIENGKIKLSLDAIQQIAKVLGIEPYHLLQKDFIETFNKSLSKK